MSIAPSSGSWDPPWLHGVIALVVVLSVVVATLQFGLLFAWCVNAL